MKHGTGLRDTFKRTTKKRVRQRGLRDERATIEQMGKRMTIEETEAKAHNAFNSTFTIAIRGYHLRVERCLNGRNETYYEYTWGLNKVSRDVAENVLMSMEQ